jgi:hypothetical protein
MANTVNVTGTDIIRHEKILELEFHEESKSLRNNNGDLNMYGYWGRGLAYIKIYKMNIRFTTAISIFTCNGIMF